MPNESLTRSPLHICLVAPTLLPKYVSLASHLSDAGHNVVFLFVPKDDLHGKKQKWSKTLKLPSDVSQIALPSKLDVPVTGNWNQQTSYKIFRYLFSLKETFDIIFFPEFQGIGYYSILAKNEALAFHETLVLVELFGPLKWRKIFENEYLDHYDDLIADFMEQECLRRADGVVCYDERILEWVREQEWSLPQKVCMISPFHEPALFEAFFDDFKRNSLKSQEGKIYPFPLVSVCIPTYNRPNLLAQALDSIRQQDYPKIEVVLVDDGSTMPEAVEFLNSLKPEFESKNWQIIRQENQYVGAALNNAVRHARGEYLLIMGDDNLAMPNEVSTFVLAAQKTGADILTCVIEYFRDDASVHPEHPNSWHWPPIGAAVSAGMFQNVFGDANAFIRKKVFESLGGYKEERGFCHEDWEFFSRAVLAGFKLEVVPIPLFQYRVHKDNEMQKVNLFHNYSQAILPYLNSVPKSLQDILKFAQGAKFRLENVERKEKVLRATLNPFTRFTKKIFGPSFKLVPLHDLKRIGRNRWLATGNDPQFLLSGKKFVPGTYCVEIQIEIFEKKNLFFSSCFYLDLGSGFQADTIISLPAQNGEIFQEITIPPGTRAVRFDPMSFPCKFRLAAFLMYRVSP
jgi:glycosyltransferase involved in cell wall biosynthesis